MWSQRFYLGVPEESIMCIIRNFPVYNYFGLYSFSKLARWPASLITMRKKFINALQFLRIHFYYYNFYFHFLLKFDCLFNPFNCRSDWLYDSMQIVLVTKILCHVSRKLWDVSFHVFSLLLSNRFQDFFTSVLISVHFFNLTLPVDASVLFFMSYIGLVLYITSFSSYRL